MGTLYIAFHPNKIDPSNFNLIQVYSISQDTTIKEKQRNDLVDLDDMNWIVEERRDRSYGSCKSWRKSN